MSIENKVLELLKNNVNNILLCNKENIEIDPIAFQRQQFEMLDKLSKKYINSKQNKIFFDIDLILKIAEVYISIHTTNNNIDNLFNKMKTILNNTQDSYISDMYIVNKMVETAKQHINEVKNISPECVIKAIKFIAKFGAIYLKETEIVYLNILYFDTYKKENIIELAKVIKIDGSRVICENEKEVFMIENDEIVIFHKPLKNGLEKLISKDVFFEKTTNPKGFKVEYSLTDCY